MNQTDAIIEAELVPAVDAQLTRYAGQTGLEKTATETLVEAFRPVFLKAREAIAEADGVAASVKDATCVKEIKKSRACRLAIRAVRLEGEAIHKKQKESALRFGRAVDGFRNILLADIEPVETALQEAEDTAERAEAARLAALKASREAELKPFLDGPDAPFLSDLSTLTEKAFSDLLANYKLLRQAKLDAIAKAEAERKAKEEADRLERERINAENERLKAEVIAREAAAKAEREAAEKKLAEERAVAAKARAEAEAKAKAEREAIEAEARKERLRLHAIAEVERQKLAALEAEAKALRDAESKKAAAAAAAAKKAAAAPDRAKLLAFADLVSDMEVPSLNDEAMADSVRARVRGLASWCAEQATKLE